MPNNLPVEIDDKETKFALALFDSKTAIEAGRKAGYSDVTLKSGYIYKKLRDPKFQEKLKSVAIANDWQDVSKAYQIQAAAIDAAQEIQTTKDVTPQDKIQAARAVKDIIKEKKQSTGILNEQVLYKPNLNFIAVNARSLMLELNNPEQVQEAEVVE